MSIESTDDGANGEYFEVLHILIPRYLRVIEANKEDAFKKWLHDKYFGRVHYETLTESKLVSYMTKMENENKEMDKGNNKRKRGDADPNRDKEWTKIGGIFINLEEMNELTQRAYDMDPNYIPNRLWTCKALSKLGTYQKPFECPEQCNLGVSGLCLLHRHADRLDSGRL